MSGAAGKEARTSECLSLHSGDIVKETKQKPPAPRWWESVSLGLPSVEWRPSSVPSSVSVLPAPPAPTQTLFSGAVMKTSYPPPALFSEDRAGALRRANAGNSCRTPARPWTHPRAHVHTWGPTWIPEGKSKHTRGPLHTSEGPCVCLRAPAHTRGPLPTPKGPYTYPRTPAHTWGPCLHLKAHVCIYFQAWMVTGSYLGLGGGPHGLSLRFFCPVPKGAGNYLPRSSE